MPTILVDNFAGNFRVRLNRCKEFLCYILAAMKHALIVAILALLQTPAVPRKAASEASKQSQNVPSDASRKKAPAAELPVGNSRQSEIPKQNAPRTTTQDEKKSEPVRVAPVELHKDWTDYLYLAASLILTIATLILAIFASRQAKAAKDNAAAAKASADAASRNTNAFISSERPWIVATPETRPFTRPPEPDELFSTYARLKT